MKLKKTFVTHTVAGSQIMVPVGESAKNLRGFVRSNETAAFIVDLLKKDTSIDEMVSAVCGEYDADLQQAEAAVQYVIDQLRKLNALEE